MSQTTARGVDYRERLGVPKPAITRHVKVLEGTGVLTRAVEGRTRVLSLGLDVLREVAEWMDRQRAVWGSFIGEYLKEEGAK